MKPPTVPILMYHQVTAQPLAAFRKYAVSTAAFAAQMRWLALAGYQSISLDRLLAARAGRQRLPPRPVVITFDDGFADCLAYAVPILQAHGFRAVFYLVAGLAGQASAWLAAERGVSLPLLTWAQARQLEAAGFECGGHSLTHPRLAELDAAACRHELGESRRRLEAELGHAVIHLAYPHGSYNAMVQAIAAECGYQTACTVRIGLASAADPPLALQRVPILGQDSLLDFIFRLRTAHTARETLRQLRSGLRRRPAVIA